HSYQYAPVPSFAKTKRLHFSRSTVCVLDCLAFLILLGLSGCTGAVSGNTGNQPPAALDITNVQAPSPTASSAVISCTTNIAADSSIDYGTTASYGSNTPVDPTMVTNHQVSISGLAAGTTYYFQVTSTDSKNNQAKSGGHSFKTPPSGSPTITTQPTNQTFT